MGSSGIARQDHSTCLRKGRAYDCCVQQANALFIAKQRGQWAEKQSSRATAGVQDGGISGFSQLLARFSKYTHLY